MAGPSVVHGQDERLSLFEERRSELVNADVDVNVNLDVDVSVNIGVNVSVCDRGEMRGKRGV